MAKTDDGKIRMRCPGCGKRVKFPANVPGTTFRCPICHTSMVSPLDAADADKAPSIEELIRNRPSRSTAKRAVTAPSPKPKEPATPVSRKPAPARRPSDKSETPAIDRLNAFLLKEQQRIGGLVSQIIRDSRLSDEEKTAELLSLRHQKAVGLRSLADVMFRDINRTLARLRDDPAVDTESGKARIAAVEREKRGLELFLKVMFQIRTVSQDNRLNGATHDTREGAEAPPSKPSQPGTETR